MIHYRLIALDMDGTLLCSDKTIAPATLEAVAAANRAGRQVVICTGRPVCELAPYRSTFTDIRYCICESGSLLYDLRKERVLAKHTLDPAAVPQIIRAIGMEDIMPQAMIDGQSFVGRADIERMAHYRMEVYIPLYRETATPVDDVLDVIRTRAGEIEKINLYHVDREASIRTSRRLQSEPIERIYAETSSLELSPLGSHKGVGLRELAALLQIPPEETIAVGDADNDLPMLEAAGLAVAMGNANEHVLQAADLVTSDNDHDGCGEVIRRYLLAAGDTTAAPACRPEPMRSSAGTS